MKKADESRNVLEDIAQEYDLKVDSLKEFTSIVQNLIITLLGEAGLRVHSVTSRVKTKESVLGKVKKATEEKYQSLNDVTDMSGIRIITFFPDEVDVIAELIQKEFSIDNEHSVDKRTLLDPDRFGYLSLHYIASFSPARLRLAEYKRCSGLRTEIQIRSLLQHTWAEIEHDLGYKTKLAVPRSIRRRFSQLAGLLELADDTFVQIRNSLSDYEKTVAAEIKEAPHLVQVDQTSLLSFLKGFRLSHQIDSEIASNLNYQLEDFHDPTIGRNIARLNGLGIQTIAQLRDLMTRRKDDIVRLATGFLFENAKEHEGAAVALTTHVSLLYLIYLLLTEKYPDQISLNKELANSGMDKKSAERVVEQLLIAYKNLKPN